MSTRKLVIMPSASYWRNTFICLNIIAIFLIVAIVIVPIGGILLGDRLLVILIVTSIWVGLLPFLLINGNMRK